MSEESKFSLSYFMSISSCRITATLEIIRKGAQEVSTHWSTPEEVTECSMLGTCAPSHVRLQCHSHTASQFLTDRNKATAGAYA